MPCNLVHMLSANPRQAASPGAGPSLGLADIYYALFRHKWKIAICSSLGILLGVAAFKLQNPPFQSQAKLFVRYVLSEGRNVGPGLNATAKSPDRSGETIMTSEMEILTSFNLAKTVAETVGPAKILVGSKEEPNANTAAIAILNGLAVSVAPKSSVIHISFTHKNPEIVQPVLTELVQVYLKTHGEVHRAKASGGDFLISETDQYRARLVQTEEELRKIRNRAGVISVDDAKKTLTQHIATVREQIFTAEAELAQRTSHFKEMAKEAEKSATPVAAPSDPIPARDKVEEYKLLVSRVATYQRLEQELLVQFTSENARVKEVRALLATAEAAKQRFENDFPEATVQAVARAPGTVPSLPRFDGVTTAADLHALRARINTLNTQLTSLREEALKIDAVEGELSQLQRKKELDEANYRLFAASLEQSRIAEAFGDGQISNITQVQTPSPAAPNFKAQRVALFGLMAGGIALGLGWAFLIEFYLDRSIRRPIDVERLMPYPLFLSIPVSGLKKGMRKQAAPASGDASLDIAGSVRGSLRVFYETLRDRLISYCEGRGLTHKPKLIALTGLHIGAGVTTTAAGLARSLSETGDGNVLLVDMTGTQGSAQQFMAGKAVCGLDEMLDTKAHAHVQENLYVVSESTNSDALSRNIPQRFSKLLPKLKASDFDYIIFDMPPVNQISITLRLAAFMDIVLVVIESEKTNRENAQRAAALLAQSRAHVGLVLNKTRSYLPNAMEQELIGV